MAKSFVYFSAGVSGESRPPLARLPATTDVVDYVVTSRPRCNIVYEKDPANGRARAAVDAAAVVVAAIAPVHPAATRRAEKMGRSRALAWLWNFFNYVTTKFARGENSRAYRGIAGMFTKAYGCPVVLTATEGVHASLLNRERLKDRLIFVVSVNVSIFPLWEGATKLRAATCFSSAVHSSHEIIIEKKRGEFDWEELGKACRF